MKKEEALKVIDELFDDLIKSNHAINLAETAGKTIQSGESKGEKKNV